MPQPFAGGVAAEAFFIERRHHTVARVLEQHLHRLALVVEARSCSGAASRQAEKADCAQKRQAAVSHSASDLSSSEISMRSYSSLVAMWSNSVSPIPTP